MESRQTHGNYQQQYQQHQRQSNQQQQQFQQNYDHNDISNTLPNNYSNNIANSDIHLNKQQNYTQKNYTQQNQQITQQQQPFTQKQHQHKLTQQQHSLYKQPQIELQTQPFTQQQHTTDHQFQNVFQKQQQQKQQQQHQQFSNQTQNPHYSLQQQLTEEQQANLKYSNYQQLLPNQQQSFQNHFSNSGNTFLNQQQHQQKQTQQQQQIQLQQQQQQIQLQQSKQKQQYQPHFRKDSFSQLHQISPALLHSQTTTTTPYQNPTNYANNIKSHQTLPTSYNDSLQTEQYTTLTTPQQQQPSTNSSQSSDGGRFQFEDGGCYAGKWQNGMAHGYGTCLTGGGSEIPNGGSTRPTSNGEFAGLWQEGFELSGIYQCQDGDIYEGQWLQGKRHGLGREKKGRWVYRGEWSQGVKGRYGCRQSSISALKYEGTWNDAIQDGYGVETYPDGGTFHGQWMRGMRHGYGVRQSVAYGVALRIHNEVHMTAAVAGMVETANIEISYDRDKRVEDNRGGFVLQARTSIPSDASNKTNKRQGLFDKIGRPAFKRSLTRQKSASDLISPGYRSASVGPSSRTSSAAGSVRSTTSAFSQISSAFSTLTTGTRRSSMEDDDELGSFCSDVDLANDRVTEKYAGEWKNDKRSGYGVCERSDGVKYEGEWLNNRKHGYGVTTLIDHTRVEGKYKNNVMVSSGKSTKFFAIRGSKIKDRVDAAVLLAHKSAGMANQKMEIANVRMTSACMKSNQVEEVVTKALSDADKARTVAKQYQFISNQESKIIANRQPSIELNPMGHRMNQIGNLKVQAGNIIATDQTKDHKKFTFFKFKKSQSRSKSETRENQRTGFSFFGNQRSSSIKKLSETTSDGSILPDFNLPTIKPNHIKIHSPINPANITLDINTGKKFPNKQSTTPVQSLPERALQTSSQLEATSHTPFKPNTPDVYRRTIADPFSTEIISPQQRRIHQQNYPQQQSPKIFVNSSKRASDYTDVYPQIQINSIHTDDLNSMKEDFLNSEAKPENMTSSTEHYPSRQSRQNGYNRADIRYNVNSNRPSTKDTQSSYELSATHITPESHNWSSKPPEVSSSINNPYHSGPQHASMWNQTSRDNPVQDKYYTVSNQTPLVNNYIGNSLQLQRQKQLQQQQQQQKQLQQQQNILQQQLNISQQQYQHPQQEVLYDNYGRPYPDYSQTPTLEDEEESLKERRKSLPSIVNNANTSKSTQTTPSTGGIFSYASSSKSIQSAMPQNDRYVIENGIRKRLKAVEVTKQAKTTADVPTYRLESIKSQYKRGDMGSMPNVSAVNDSEVLPREIVYQMSQQKREELMVQRHELERREEEGSLLASIEDLFEWLWQWKVMVVIFIVNVLLLRMFYNLVRPAKQ